MPKVTRTDKKPLEQFLTLLLGFSGLLALTGFSGCDEGPKVTVYISTPARGGMNFSSQTESGFVLYSKTDKYVCFTPDDTQTLLDYCKISQDSLSQLQDDLN